MIAVLTALALSVSATPATAELVPYLPAPTGSRPVGATSLYLVDSSRADPWVPSVPVRELMVSLFYPAATAKGQKVQYMTPEESTALLTGSDITQLPPDILSTTRTNAIRDARPALGRRPLIVLSPGFTKPRATLSGWAEDLASHGYLVAVVDHTYESYGTSFPGGRFMTCASCEFSHEDWFAEKRGLVRAADVSFVLDKLVPLLKPSRIGMAGHSAGGAASIPAMVGDSRILAGMDVDGSTYNPIPPPGLSRPFMFVSHQLGPVVCEPGTNPQWERDWPQMTGWKRWVEVEGTAHASFTDVGLFAEQAGLDIGASVGGARVQAIARAYVRAFFDQHLRGVPQSLLDGPVAGYPEVKFCR